MCHQTGTAPRCCAGVPLHVVPPPLSLCVGDKTSKDWDKEEGFPVGFAWKGPCGPAGQDHACSLPPCCHSYPAPSLFFGFEKKPRGPESWGRGLRRRERLYSPPRPPASPQPRAPGSRWTLQGRQSSAGELPGAFLGPAACGSTALPLPSISTDQLPGSISCQSPFITFKKPRNPEQDKN